VPSDNQLKAEKQGEFLLVKNKGNNFHMLRRYNDWILMQKSSIASISK
jgi:hypothetical protein